MRGKRKAAPGLSPEPLPCGDASSAFSPSRRALACDSHHRLAVNHLHNSRFVATSQGVEVGGVEPHSARARLVDSQPRVPSRNYPHALTIAKRSKARKVLPEDLLLLEGVSA